MALENLGEFAAAGDGTTALVIKTPGSKSRAAVEELLAVVAEAILTGDPFIRDAAAAALTDAASSGRFVKALDAPIVGDDGSTYIGSQSGYALLGWKSNGDLSTWTRGFLKQQVADTVEAPKIPGVFKVELTPSGYPLRIVYDDGRQEFPGLVVSGATGGGVVVPDTVGGVTYLTDVTTGIRSRVVPTDRTRLVINGTSTFAGMTAQFGTFAGAHGASVVNTATAGVGAEHTLAKLGSRPFLTSGSTTIAGSGTSSVSSSNVPSSIFNAWSVAGYFEGFSGVHGTISKPGGGGAASWTFTRDADGAGFTVPAGTKFIPDAAAFRDAILVLNVGKNNLSGGVDGVTTDVAQVIQWTKDAYAWATSTGKSVLVVGHYQDTGTVADSSARARINAYNDAMRSYFGARFVDMGAYVGSTQIFTDLGLTPDSADLAEIALGNKAPQISAYSSGSWPSGTVDPLHLSTAAKNAVMDNRIGRALAVTLNWMQE